jgi:hypothetical protein
MAAPSITTTNAGNVSHPQAPLGGPVFFVLRGIGYLVPVAAVVLIVDALRRPATHFGGNSSRRWMWAGPQVLLLVLLAVAWLVAAVLRGVPTSTVEAITGVVALYLFFALFHQLAYLLVVVFPRHDRPIPPEVEDELPPE